MGQNLAKQISNEKKKIEFENGLYYGEIMNGLPNGLGMKQITNEGDYHGQFVNGKRQGFGRIFYLNGEYYFGFWLNDLQDGIGNYFFNDGSHYHGNFKQGMMEGKGYLYSPYQSYFKGFFHENQKNGKGIRVKSNGKVYDQIWVMGRMIIEYENNEKTIAYIKRKSQNLKGKNFRNKQTFEKFILSQKILERMQKIQGEVVYKVNDNLSQQSNSLSIMNLQNDMKNHNCLHLNKTIKQYSSDEIGDILKSQNLEMVSNIFKENNINGKALLLLKKQDLKDMGINSVGEIILIKDIIKKLKQLDQKMKIYRNFQNDKPKYLKNSLKQKVQQQNLDKNCFVKKNISQAEIVLNECKISNNDSGQTQKKFISSKYSKQTKNIFGPSTPNLVKCLDNIQLDSQNQNEEKQLLKMNTLDDRFSEQYNTPISLKSDNEQKKIKNNLLIDDGAIMNINDQQKTFTSQENFDEQIYSIVPEKLHNFIIQKKELQIIEEIGFGAVGKVYRGKYASTNVAIKVFDNKTHSKEIQEQFFEEAEIQYKLRSPYIVLFMGVCIQLGEYMLITELMDKTLFELLHENKVKLQFYQKLRILKAIANGMSHLHQENVLHCDLKSSNILLSSDYKRIKICDFGLSQMKSKIQKRNAIQVISNWLAPEVLRDHNHFESSDVYSFGVIMWEIYHEEIPWGNLSQNQIIGFVGFDQESHFKIKKDFNNKFQHRFIKLMNSCLNKNFLTRPRFSNIKNEIELIKIDFKEYVSINQFLLLYVILLINQISIIISRSNLHVHYVRNSNLLYYIVQNNYNIRKIHNQNQIKKIVFEIFDSEYIIKSQNSKINRYLKNRIHFMNPMFVVLILTFMIYTNQAQN